MYEEQLFARVPSRCLLSRGPSLGSRNRGEVGRHFRPLGRPAPPGLEAELWLQCVPESPHFLRENNSMKSTLRPRSFSSGGGVRFSSNRSCPSRLRGGPRALPSRPQKRPDSGGGGRSPEPGVRPRGVEERPPPRLGRGTPRLSGAGPGSSRGDGAPERALFGAPATLRTSFQPPASPTPSLRVGPVCFSSPAPSTRSRKRPSGLRH